NAMRILDGMGISYEVLEYDIDPRENEDIAMYTSQKLGIPAEKICKTLVMASDSNEIFVFCLPALFEVSLKKARAASGCSGIDLIKPERLSKLTGYIRGGCSPLGMTHRYPTFIEELVQLEDFIYISGGQRGISLKIAPDDLARAAGATFASLVS
ncbi:MAG: aminoacyl-tRNA deacylase, partial [Sphaerochaetaceae bacterium]